MGLTAEPKWVQTERMNQNRNGYNLDLEVAAEVRSSIARIPGASVKGIAETLDIRRATLSQRVNGHVPFSPALLSGVARELGTTASEIVRRAEATLAETHQSATKKVA